MFCRGPSFLARPLNETDRSTFNVFFFTRTACPRHSKIPGKAQPPRPGAAGAAGRRNEFVHIMFLNGMSRSFLRPHAPKRTGPPSPCAGPSGAAQGAPRRWSHFAKSSCLRASAGVAARPAPAFIPRPFRTAAAPPGGGRLPLRPPPFPVISTGTVHRTVEKRNPSPAALLPRHCARKISPLRQVHGKLFRRSWGSGYENRGTRKLVLQIVQRSLDNNVIAN